MRSLSGGNNMGAPIARVSLTTAFTVPGVGTSTSLTNKYTSTNNNEKKIPINKGSKYNR